MAYNKKSKENLKLFKAGESGNKKGRPEGAISIKTILNKYLDTGSGIVNELTGKKMTLREQITFEQIRKATEGDLGSFKEIMDRIEGKPMQKSEVENTNHYPDGIEIEFIKVKKNG